MECPGLNGVWRACPASIPGLTSVERDVFGALGGPLLLVVIVSALAIMTVLAFTLTDGLGIGSSLRPRRWARVRRIEAARRHNARLAHVRLVERAAARRGRVVRSFETARPLGPFGAPARRPAHSILAATRVHLRRGVALAARRLRPALADVADAVGASAETIAASAEAVATSARESIGAIASNAPSLLAPPVVANADTGRRRRVRLTEAPNRARLRARTGRRGSRSAAGRGRIPGSRVGA